MRSRVFSLVALSLFAFEGCSSKTDPASATVTGDAGAIDAAPCVTDQHRADSGNCDSILSWTAGPALASARAQHVTFVMDAIGKSFIYVVGGTDYKTDLADASFAPIAADGTIGAWATTNGLPTARKGAGVSVSGSVVVLSGGKLDTAIVANVFFSLMQDDGSLAKWLPGPDLPAPRFGHGSVVANGNLYVTGGVEASTASPKVFRSPVGQSGLGDWKEVTALPAPRTHHASFVDGSFLYVVGGYDGDPGASANLLSDVLRAPISADGSLGAWTQVGGLDTPLATESAIVHDGYVYLLGGAENGNDMVDHIRRATIAADGTMGAWTVTSPALPKARGYDAYTPLYKSRVYSVGGTADQMSALGDVNVGTFQ